MDGKKGRKVESRMLLEIRKCWVWDIPKMTTEIPEQTTESIWQPSTPFAHKPFCMNSRNFLIRNAQPVPTTTSLLKDRHDIPILLEPAGAFKALAPFVPTLLIDAALFRSWGDNIFLGKCHARLSPASLSGSQP